MAQEAPNGWSDALALAVDRHGETLRKGGGRIPYVTHVVDVAETLAYHYPERDDLIVAGLLHDVVEDTSTTLHEVRWRFGDAVADLVRAVSKDDAAMEQMNGWTVADRTAGTTADERRAWLWRARREFMLAHLRLPSDDHDEAAKDVFRLKAADAHANLGAIARDLRNVGPSVWARFKVGRDDSLWFYRSIVERVEAAIGDEPLAQELRNAFEGVDAMGQHERSRERDATTRGGRLTAAAFRIALAEVLEEATRSGATFFDVSGRDLHRRVGGYPGPSHAMPNCCSVLRATMKSGDIVLAAPPKGVGASLKIRYALPR